MEREEKPNTQDPSQNVTRNDIQDITRANVQDTTRENMHNEQLISLIPERCARCKEYSELCDIFSQYQSVIKNCTEAQELFITHLKDVIQKTEEGATIVIKNTQETHNAIDKLVEYVNTTMLESKQWFEGLNLSVQSSETSSQEMQVFLDAKLKQLQLSGSTASALLDTLRSLPRTISELDQEAFQIKLISVNASIEAARLDVQGAGISAVAKGITDVSLSIREQLQFINATLQGISKTIKQVFVESCSEEHLEKEGEQIAVLQKKIHENNDIVKSIYTELKNFSSAIMQKVDSGSRDLSNMAFGILGSVQYQDMIRQQLEMVIKTGEMVTENVTLLLQKSEKNEFYKWKPFDLQGVYSSYVMQSQRTAHINHFAQEGMGQASLMSENANGQEANGAVPEIKNTNNAANINEANTLPKIELF